MPIKGLERRMRIPRLGRIGLGITVASKSGNDRPTEVSYFVVPEDIAKVYGEKPTVLPVRFPFAESERVLHSIYYVKRAGRSKVRQCDGVQFTQIGKGGDDVCGPCPKPDDIYKPCPEKCRATAKLAVVIPQTPLGIWEVNVGGLQRIADLLAELQHFEAAMGPLTRYQFNLVRQETEEQYFKDDGAQATRTGYPVHVRTPFTIEEVQALRGEQIAVAGAPMPALAASVHEETVVDEDDDDPGDAPSTAQPAPARPGKVHPVMDECFDLAQKLDVDAATYRAYLLAVHGTVDLGDATAMEEIERLKMAASTPHTAGAAKAAMRAKSRRAPGQGSLV